MAKYKNKPIQIHGIWFQSEKEGFRYMELLSELQAGKIECLELQKEYELIPKQQKSNGKFEQPVKYKADFAYVRDGKEYVEDTKGFRTKDYVIKRKLMLFVHGVEIVES